MHQATEAFVGDLGRRLYNAPTIAVFADGNEEPLAVNDRRRSGRSRVIAPHDRTRRRIERLQFLFDHDDQSIARDGHWRVHLDRRTPDFASVGQPVRRDTVLECEKQSIAGRHRRCHRRRSDLDPPDDRGGKRLGVCRRHTRVAVESDREKCEEGDDRSGAPAVHTL